MAMPYSDMKRGSILTDIQAAAADRLSSAAERMGPSGKILAERGREISEDVQSSLISAVRSRPLATVAAVAVVSFALGALWRR